MAIACAASPRGRESRAARQRHFASSLVLLALQSGCGAWPARPTNGGRTFLSARTILPASFRYIPPSGWYGLTPNDIHPLAPPTGHQSGSLFRHFFFHGGHQRHSLEQATELFLRQHRHRALAFGVTFHRFKFHLVTVEPHDADVFRALLIDLVLINSHGASCGSGMTLASPPVIS